MHKAQRHMVKRHRRQVPMQLIVRLFCARSDRIPMDPLPLPKSRRSRGSASSASTASTTIIARPTSMSSTRRHRTRSPATGHHTRHRRPMRPTAPCHANLTRPQPLAQCSLVQCSLARCSHAHISIQACAARPATHGHPKSRRPIGSTSVVPPLSIQGATPVRLIWLHIPPQGATPVRLIWLHIPPLSN